MFCVNDRNLFSGEPSEVLGLSFARCPLLAIPAAPDSCSVPVPMSGKYSGFKLDYGSLFVAEELVKADCCCSGEVKGIGHPGEGIETFRSAWLCQKG